MQEEASQFGIEPNIGHHVEETAGAVEVPDTPCPIPLSEDQLAYLHQLLTHLGDEDPAGVFSDKAYRQGLVFLQECMVNSIE